jgi:hypothetical protein
VTLPGRAVELTLSGKGRRFPPIRPLRGLERRTISIQARRVRLSRKPTAGLLTKEVGDVLGIRPARMGKTVENGRAIDDALIGQVIEHGA